MALDGKVCVITGAGGGIGRACALELARSGANVVLIDLFLDAAERVASELRANGHDVMCFSADIRDSARIKEIMRKAHERYGSIDALINNAGGPSDWIDPEKYPRARFEATREEAWRQTIEVNLLGTLIVTHAALKYMLPAGRGSIINIGSVAGVNGIATMADYSAAKGGVIAFTKALAIELGKHGIRVNCISPGSIVKNGIAPATYLPRAGEPEDVAQLALFLAGDGAGFITGQNYIIDGGRTLSMKCD